MADTQKLKDMLDNIALGNTEEAQVDFHGFLRDKMQEHLGTNGMYTKVDVDAMNDETEAQIAANAQTEE